MKVSSSARTSAFCLLVFLFALVAGPSLAASRAKPASEVVATVNDEPITRSELNIAVDQMENRMMRQGKKVDESQKATMEKEALDSLIRTELLYQAGLKAGAGADKARVDKQFSTYRQRFSSQAEFDKMLDHFGMTQQDLRREIKRSLTIRKYMDQVTASVKVPEKELKAYYKDHPKVFTHPEQVRASHILVQVKNMKDEKEKNAAKKKIEAIQARLKKGEDFAALARKMSDCPSSKKGGDLGYFARGQMVKPFEDAAFALEPGQMSPIVETRFGYHIIKLTDKKPAGAIPYSEVKAKIEKYLRQTKAQDLIWKNVDQLKAKAKIKVFLKS